MAGAGAGAAGPAAPGVEALFGGPGGDRSKAEVEAARVRAEEIATRADGQDLFMILFSVVQRWAESPQVAAGQMIRALGRRLRGVLPELVQRVASGDREWNTCERPWASRALVSSCKGFSRPFWDLNWQRPVLRGDQFWVCL